MERQESEAVWRMWVDTERRIVSFHEEPGSQLLEFRSRELFQACSRPASTTTPPGSTATSERVFFPGIFPKTALTNGGNVIR